MRRIAEGMLTLGLSCDLILSSLYLRAKQTANIVADVFHAQGRLHIAAMLAPDGNPHHVIEVLNRRYRAQQNILLVGHEPHLSGLNSVPVSGSPDFHVAMKKGALCKLSVEALPYGPCATLEWLMTPANSAYSPRAMLTSFTPLISGAKGA